MLDAGSETRPAGPANVADVADVADANVLEKKDMTKAGLVGRCKHSELNRAMYTSGELCECATVQYKWNFGLHSPHA